jgi:hypothetical protein
MLNETFADGLVADPWRPRCQVHRRRSSIIIVRRGRGLRIAGVSFLAIGRRPREERHAMMDRFYVQLNKILGEQGEGEGPRLTRAQIYEIGVRAVEKAVWPQSDELRPWAERVVAGLPDKERQLENVG